MLAVFILLITSSFATLPIGEGDLQWGASEQTLIDQYNVTKVDPKNPQGNHFTEFMEIDPEVYIDRSTPGKKFEFYFYQGKLYKTFVIHLDQSDAQARYEKKVKAKAKIKAAVKPKAKAKPKPKPKAAKKKINYKSK